MDQFLVIFREPDGRKDDHTPEVLAAHRQAWSVWMQQMGGRLAGGAALTAEGRTIRPDRQIVHSIHTVGTEIVGGYLLIHAHNLDEAARLLQTCPVFDFGGYAEIRGIM